MNSFSKLILASVEASNQPVEQRRLGRDDVDGFGISTVLSPDMGYETALCDTAGNWHPVERYPSRDDAWTGHAKWVQFVRDGNREFVQLGYDDIVDEERMTLS